MEDKLGRLKRKAAALYKKAYAPSELDCGNQLLQVLEPHRGVAEQELRKVWAEIKKLDPEAPDL